MQAASPENESSDRDSQEVTPVLEAEPAPAAVAAALPSVHRRIKVVQSKRPRPPLAPGTKSAVAAAASEGAGREKKVSSGRRSFLTLAVSTGEK